MDTHVNYYTAYTDLANERRGLILSTVINLERAIDEFFGYFFCEKNEEKRNEIMTFIFCSGKIGLGYKCKLFIQLVKSIYPKDNFWQETFEDIQALEKSINILVYKRNCLAHRNLDESNYIKDFLEKKTVYKEYYTDPLHVPDINDISELTEQKYNQFIDDVFLSMHQVMTHTAYFKNRLYNDQGA